VRFHRTADRRTDHGGGADMQWVVDGNALGFDEFGGGVLDRSEWEWLIADTRAELERVAPLLDRRRDTGFVRQGHGDLHLRNIVLLDGEPTLFDAIEFNDEIACVDVLYDLAFLLMDLWRRALPAHANTVWNRYLGETGDVGGIALTPFFLSCRAAVRAKTSATAASLQKDERRASERQQLARDYLAMAKSLLHPPRPWLIALGGVSGSGKSTLARGLAPCVGAAPGAVILRSDEIRKRACGVAMLDRLGPQGYAPEVSARVYEAMREQAFRIVDGGHSAILDAVYAKGSDRLAIEQVAARARVPFAGIWLDAPDEALLQRVAGRRGDPSDAGAAVVRLQRAQDVGIVGWPSLDASRPADVVLDDATRLLLNRGAITTTRAACEPSRA
jgi:predicted kinase